MIIQYTTPTFFIRMPKRIDMSMIHHLYFTAEQNKQTVITKTRDIVVEGHMISVYLSQEETALLSDGFCVIQLNWTYDNGRRMASVPKTVRVGKNLLKEVIE